MVVNEITYPGHLLTDLSALADASGHFAGVLVVKNEWGDRTAKAFSCTASDDDDAAAPSAR